MKNFLLLAACLLPASRLKNFFLRLLGFQIHATAHFSPSLVWRVKSFRLSRGSKLRGMNVIRDVAELDLGEFATIGSWNWISAAPGFSPSSRTFGSLILGDHSAITSRHYIDVSGGVHIGALSTVAGQRSTILTHGIDFKNNVQRCSPVEIGDRSFVSTNCVLLAGSRLPSRSVLGAGAVLTENSNTGAQGLWGGVPAKFIKSSEGRYFDRDIGFVKVSKDHDEAVQIDNNRGM